MGKLVDHMQGSVLVRHQERRAQGVPTLSVLVGELEIARWCWTGWRATLAQPFACSTAASVDALVRDWLSGAGLRAALARELAARGAAEEGVSSDALTARLRAHPETRRQRAFEQLSARLGWSASLIAAVAEPRDDALAAWLLDGFPGSLAALGAALGADLPALLVEPPRAVSAAELHALMSALLRVTEAAPSLDLACALTEAQLVRWRQDVSEPELHRVGQGLIRVEPALEPTAGEPEGGRRRSRSSQRRAALASAEPAGGVPRLLYDAREFARARAERALFEHLEARPGTSGLFVRAGVVAGGSGAPALEVTLLSEPLRVALMIDGFHHFADAAAYRQERDKDLRLQQLGYTVVRVLAADVGAELDAVLGSIDAVVEHARRGRGPDGARGA